MSKESLISKVNENLARPNETTLHDDNLVTVRKASEIEMRPIRWLWQGYVAQGVLHILAGVPGCGKTTIALSLAATVSSGGRWPDGSRAPQGDVVIWSGEDIASDTLIPRLVAAGADLTRVHIVESVMTADGRRPFDPAIDFPMLNRQLTKLPGARLLIIDPIVAAVAGDSHKNAETRRSLQPVVDLARERGIATFGITHYTKGTKGRDPLERVTGSLAFGALARVVFGTARNTEDDSPAIFARVKSNVGPDGGGFEYHLDFDELAEGIVGSRIRWGAPVEGSAREILGQCEELDDSGGTEREEAAEWLRTELDYGPVQVKELQKLARDAGHAWPTVKRAKELVGAVADKTGFAAGWRWRLPHSTVEEDHTRERDPLRGETPRKASTDAGSIEGDHDALVSDPLRSSIGQGDHPVDNLISFGETRATQGFEANSVTEGDHPAVCGPLRTEVVV